MTPLLAQARRGDRAFERFYRRHAGGVYRYALVLLRDPEDAEQVTRSTFQQAYRAFERGDRPRNARAWVLGLAHGACRQRVEAPHAVLNHEEAELAEPDPAVPTTAEGTLRCDQAERAISRGVDGRLPRSERRALRSHLRHCHECEGFARGQRAQRSAWRALARILLH